jgi:hypothetical protein
MGDESWLYSSPPFHWISLRFQHPFCIKIDSRRAHGEISARVDRRLCLSGPGQNLPGERISSYDSRPWFPPSLQSSSSTYQSKSAQNGRFSHPLTTGNTLHPWQKPVNRGFQKRKGQDSIDSSSCFYRKKRIQGSLCCFSEWSRSATFWAIKGALPPARLLIMKFTWILICLDTSSYDE